MSDAAEGIKDAMAENQAVATDAMTKALNATPKWALATFGILFFFAIYMVFTGTNSAFNRVINAYALKIEASADTSVKKIDVAVDKLNTAVDGLSIKLGELSAKIDTSIARLDKLEADVAKAEVIILDHESRLSGIEGRYYGRSRPVHKAKGKG